MDEEAPVAAIDLTAGPLVSYAMAHNGVRLVERVTVTSGRDLSGAVLSLEVRDSEGRLTAPCELGLDLITGSSTVLDRIELLLDASVMLQVTEERPGTLVATLRHDGYELAAVHRAVRVMSASHWLSVPPELSLELLPAFVMPNDPEVAQLLTEAGSHLQRQTGSPSLQGYQGGPDRVDQIVAAVVAAFVDRHVTYAEAPASWHHGQKVRTPTDVLVGRLGTCLDTTVVLAAALEQAGIKPLLWVTDRHAFVGYWREEEASLGSVVHTEVRDIVNLVDLGLLRLVETTRMTSTDLSPSLDELHRAAYEPHLAGDLAGVRGVVDVYRARRNDVLPLPSRARDASGALHVVEYRPAVHSAPPAVRQPQPQQVTARTGTPVPPRVTQWKNALLDLTLRNKLINFTARYSVALSVPRDQLGEVEDQLHEGRKLSLLASDQYEDVHRERGVRTASDLPEAYRADLIARQQVFTDVTAAAYSTRLRNLAYKARTIVEETGANNLYLALGALSWEWEGRPLQSPLVLVPVKLVARARSDRYSLELDETGSSTPNYCLLEKLRGIGITIPGLQEPAEDAAGIDLDAALDAVRVAIAQAGKPWRVETTAHVTVLQFAKFRLWKDLDEQWEVLTRNPLVHHLVHTPFDPFDDHVPPPAEVDLDELAARCPVPADASQLDAVADAVAGRTFVLEGPPGTGKSQTITNLLTRAVADGRRVLFVAEKRAALDVVQKRLDAVGMGPYCLDLHDKGSKPAVVRGQIRRAMDQDVAVDARGLSAVQEDLRAARRTLARYAGRVHEPNGAGLSLYSARDSLLALGDGDEFVIPASLVTGPADSLDVLRDLLRRLPDLADPARPQPHHPWGFVDAVAPGGLDVERVRRAVAAVDERAQSMPSDRFLADVVRVARCAADLTALAALAGAPPVALSALDATRDDAWDAASGSITHQLNAFLAASHPGLDLLTPDAMSLPLADIHAQAQSAAASSWFGRKKRLKAVAAQLAPAARPGAVIGHKEVVTLTAALLQVQGAVRGLASGAASVPGVVVPAGWNPLTAAGRDLVQRQLGWLRWAGRAVVGTGRAAGPATFTEALRGWLQDRGQVDPEDVARVQGIAAAVGELQLAVSVDDAAASAWSADLGFLGRWQTTVGGRAPADHQLLGLRRWVALLAHLEPMRAAGLLAARHQVLDDGVDPDDAVRAFDRGVARVSLQERRSATGLDAFDAQTHQRSIGRFTESAGALRGHLTTALPRELLNERPFRADTGRGQVGALQRELARQRGGLKVRALMQQYADLVVQLMPCVLVSPDSLARFFPATHGLFDLVVFDEASQIRVADAIGAMGRSKAVVVVGDSKQMPPSAFGVTNSEEDDDRVASGVLAVADEESILSECVQARVPSRWLSWHYRSQDESLIAFSNSHYYENRLSSFPAPSDGRADPSHAGLGISHVRVDGRFLRSGKGKLLRTNPIEAQAVFDELRRRFDAAGTHAPSVGVVTFNLQQRAYIEALLRDSGDERFVAALEDPDGLFVKNLENVQGDERDTILFSTGFSENEKGVLPLNFGPLNLPQGERRLNVAVTRARRQVVVFSSFDPAQLRSEDSTNQGLKDLRAYLDLAVAGSSETVGRFGRAPTVDRHRDEIAAALRVRGLVVRSDVGLSDFRLDLSLAVPEMPHTPLVAVLMDGEGWRRRRTVGDRDGLPVDVLSTMLRWPAVERVWLPAWLDDPDAVLDQLTRVTHEAATRVRRPAATVGPPPTALPSEPPLLRQAAPSASVMPVVPAARPTEPRPLAGETAFVPYVAIATQPRAVLDALPSRRASSTVQRMVEEVIDDEGPIHEARLAKLVAATFGLSRVSKARSAAILALVPATRRPTTDEPFAWPVGRDPDGWTGFRRAPEDTPRPIDEVSLVEIGNAMAALCQNAAGMDEDELFRESLAVFGGRRVTTAVRERLGCALSTAERRAVVVRGPAGIFR